MEIYLDSNATTQPRPEVVEVMVRYLTEEFGNAGSRTHSYGQRALRAVQLARKQVATVVAAEPHEVLFTSGATEANNMVILGLESPSRFGGRRHILSTAIEHPAVLEPLRVLSKRGFEVELVPPNSQGLVSSDAVLSRLQEETLLVSVMHVNNETGVIQPIGALADQLEDHPALLHTDAAQGFGKDVEQLRHRRIDFITVSGHKIYGPKGVGCLVIRESERTRSSLCPLMHGGGQERGLRPGTHAVHQIAGLGEASRLALAQNQEWHNATSSYRTALFNALADLPVVLHGSDVTTLPNVANFSIGSIDSEALMIQLKELVAISNGAACTSAKYEPSHVLRAMGLNDDEAGSAVRVSWSPTTPEPDWDEFGNRIRALM